MGVIGLWLETTGQAAIAAAVGAAGHRVAVVQGKTNLVGELDALIVDAAVLARSVQAITGRKMADAPAFFPVLVLLGQGAGEDAVAQALASADEVLQTPFMMAEFSGRLRILLKARLFSKLTRDLDACRLQNEAALTNTSADLARRVKMLTCLSDVHAVIQRFHQPREELFRGIATLLPPAMQYPGLASARVLADGQAFISPGFRLGHWRLSLPLAMSGQADAALEVFYEQEVVSPGDGGAFSEEEKELVRLVAQRLERTMARLGADEALRREREFSALLVNTLPGGVVRLNRAGTIVFCNPRAEAILGLDPQKLESRAYTDPGFGAATLEGRPLAPEEYPFAQVLASGKPFYDIPLSLGRPDGGRRFISVSGAPLFAADATTVDEVVLSVIDVTNQKDMERQLAHALKMESLGQLAAGIAHEINTPIQYVEGNLEFLANTFGRLVELLDRLTAAALETEGDKSLAEELAALVNDEELRFLLEETPAAIRESREGLDRVAGIVLSMKRFAHPGVETSQAVNVPQAIEDTLSVSRSAWKFVADVVTDIEPDLPEISFVPGEFNQVLLNIVVNAAQAIEEKKGDKGRIDIRALQQGDAVVVTIHDTGPGIPEAIRSRIFDPFFTTKPIGKGTGQGLAIVHAVMTRHHARLECLSTPGEGTTFILTLPLGENSSLEA